ncbi:MAG: hydrolase [Clostridia bacterium]|nr:hydrolase [Clostridia bacterium]
MDREAALELLRTYNSEPFHIEHGVTVGHVMRWFAERLGYSDEAEFWETVGILHDLDYEQWPDQHCVKVQELMKERGLDPRLIRAVASHGYGACGTGLPQPEHEMEKVLFAVDELTGLIGAAALMRPSRSCADMELKSLKKKYKDKKFAAGCSREIIAEGAERLGWELDRLLGDTLEAMKAWA